VIKETKPYIYFLSGKNNMNKDEKKPIIVKGLEFVTLGWGKKL
jgi:hypothetical protein